MAAPVLTPRAPIARFTGLGSLAASSTLVAGRCSAEWDNSTNNDFRLKVQGFFRTAGSSLQAGRIELWAFQQRDGAWPDLFTTAYTGSEAAFTITDRNVFEQAAVQLASIDTTTTQRTWQTPGIEVIGQMGGGAEKVAFFVAHNAHTGTAAWDSASASHGLVLTPYYWA
jgi:hypothetical protein